jgi:class 3 adenylate cyclase
MWLALASSVGALVLVALVVVFAIQWSVSRKNTVELAYGTATLIIAAIESMLRQNLQPAMDASTFIARRIESGAYPLEDHKRLRELFSGAVASGPQFGGIGVIDPDLQLIAVTRTPAGGIGILRSDESQNPDTVAALEALREVDGPVWGAPFHRAGNSQINVRRTLRSGAGVLGYLFATVTVTRLSEDLADLSNAFEGTGFVLYGRDEVLAHPMLSVDDSQMTPDQPLVPLDQIGDIVLASLWEAREMEGFEARTGSDVRVSEINVGNQSYVVLYRWIEDYGVVPWAVGVWFPYDLVTEPFARLQLAAVAGLAVLVLGIVAAVVLGRQLAQPIQRVAQGAARIGELEFQQVADLPPSHIRELDDQARAFNVMLHGLRKFETYVPRSLVMHLVRDSETGEHESEERELTVMFTDIVGFTALAEGLPAREVAAFLNRHFALLGACVEAEGGTIDKFMGDGLMAFWGAPERLEDPAVRACRAALAMARAIEADNHRRAAVGEPAVWIRVGIHTGPVVVGDIGAPGRINYTIVGDTVNAGQRLESLGHDMGRAEAVTILVSEAIRRQLPEGFVLEPAGSFRVRGRAEVIEVYRLTDGPGDTASPQA